MGRYRCFGRITEQKPCLYENKHYRENKPMKRPLGERSPHILAVSSNLLGFTFLVLSSIKSLVIPGTRMIDVSMAICVALFATSSFLSFLSLRTENARHSTAFELIADAAFFTGLFIVVVVSILLAFDIVELVSKH